MDASLLFMRSRPCFRTIYCFRCKGSFHLSRVPSYRLSVSSFSHQVFFLPFKYVTTSSTNLTNIYMYIYNCSLPIIRLKKIFKEENVYSLGFETVYISFLFIIMICNGISYLDAFIIRCLHWSTDAIWINTYRTLTTILLYLCDIIIIYLAQLHNFYTYPFLNISIRSREM